MKTDVWKVFEKLPQIMERHGNISIPPSQQWGGGPVEQLAPVGHHKKRWKSFQRGNNTHRQRYAYRASSNLSRPNPSPKPWQRHGTLEPQTSPHPPKRADSVTPSLRINPVGPLPPDNPLKQEMNELKETRKKRQLYWAGLIEDLGEDEWKNPANYDRQRWEDEERKADNKFEELAGLIKMAEMGFSIEAIDDHNTDGGPSGQEVENNRRFDARGRTDGAQQGRGRPLDHRRRAEVTLHRRDRNGNVHIDFRESNPNAPTKEPIIWNERKQAPAEYVG